MFKTIFLSITCLIISANALCQENFSVKDIHWNENKKLTWIDFKGTPTKENTDKIALTAASIKMEIDYTSDKHNKLVIHVYCLFKPYQSWFKKGKENNKLLEHEQLHFDITELHARILRQKLENIDISSSLLEKDLNLLFKDVFSANQKMQKKYDKETDHYRNKSAQERWKNYVEQELQKMTQYKSPIE